MGERQVGIAMSGGVDSTVCALLLKKTYPVAGFFMNLGQPDFARERERVEGIAAAIGIELRVIDLQAAFRDKVLSYFSGTYLSGMTPNPCMVCNREIKFGLFMEAIRAGGALLVATGHYARLARHEDGIALFKGVDRSKDQSYFLSRLGRHQLPDLLFPLGSLRKQEVYRLAAEHGFDDFAGRESQDVCFLKQSSVAAYLEEHHPAAIQPGPIVSTDGKIIGRHRGLYRYTVGQRRGLGLPDATPWYVTGLDAKRNRLLVGKESDLFGQTITTRSAHWLTRRPPRAGEGFTVRIRSTHRGAAATVQAIDDSSFTLRFAEPQRGIAPGQFAVLYDGERVIGSGEIITP